MAAAAMWQNHFALPTAVSSARHADRPKRRRAAVRYLAFLLQRYTQKNETIGFFGPSTWGVLSDSPEGLSVSGSHVDIAGWDVGVEDWCASALLSKLWPEGLVVAGCIPELPGGSYLSETTLSQPDGSIVSVGDDAVRVLRLCDGRRSAEAIARLAADGSISGDADTIARLLSRLVSDGVVATRPRFSPDARGSEFFQALLQLAVQAETPQAQIHSVTALQDSHADASACFRTPEPLRRALESFDAHFQRLTGSTSRRSPGEPYAGRTPLFIDAVSRARFSAGHSFIEPLVAVLCPLLDCFAWAGDMLAASLRSYLVRRLREFRPTSGPVPAEPFFRWLEERGADSEWADVDAAFRQRWIRLRTDLGPSPSVEAFSESVGRRFPSPGPLDWSPGGQFSADVIATGSRQGESVDVSGFVIGEIHSGNTLVVDGLTRLYPEREAMRLEFDGVAALHRFRPGSPLDRSSRLRPLEAESTWTLTQRHIWRRARNEVPSSRFVVDADALSVFVMCLETGMRFDALEVLSDDVNQALNRIVRLRDSDASFSPRFCVGSVVVSRARWVFDGSALPALTGTASDRFLQVSQWRHRVGLPRVVFAKTEREKKPVYVDFSSPSLVLVFESLVSHVGFDARLRCEEALPEHSGLWLTDDSSRAYTSEFRMLIQRGCPQ